MSKARDQKRLEKKLAHFRNKYGWKIPPRKKRVA